MYLNTLTALSMLSTIKSLFQFHICFWSIIKVYQCWMLQQTLDNTVRMKQLLRWRVV